MSNSHRANPRRSEGFLESAVVMNLQAQRSIESNNTIGGNTFNNGHTNLAAFSTQGGYIQVGVQSGKYPSSLHPYQELTQARLDAFPNNGEDFQQSQKRQRQSAVQPTIPTYNSTQQQLGPTSSQNMHSHSFQNRNVSGFFPQAFTGVPGPNLLHSQMQPQSNQPTVIAQQQQTRLLPNMLEQRLLSQIHHSFQEQGFNYSQQQHQQHQQQLQEEHWQNAQLHQQLHHTLQRTQPTQSNQLTNPTQPMLLRQHLQTLAPFFPPEHHYTQTAGAVPPREYSNATPRSATASGLVPARQQTHSEVYPNSTGGAMGLLDPLGISSSLLQAAEFAAMAEAAADRNKKVQKKTRRGTLGLGENAQKGSIQSQQNRPGDVQLVPPGVAASPAGSLAHSSHLQQSPFAELDNTVRGLSSENHSTASHNSSPDQLLPTQHSLDHQHQSIDRNENGGDMSANALGADVSYGVGACSSSEDGAVVVMHAGSMKTRGFHYFWSVEMDRRLKEAVGMYGTGGKGAWVKIAQFVGHNVDNEQANQRWYHYLDPAQMDRRQGPWTKEEDNLLRLLVTKALSDVEESASLTGESTEQREADCEKKSAKNEEYSASSRANGGTADQKLRAMAADQENSQLHDAVVRIGGEGGERKSDTVDRSVAMSSDHATEHARQDVSTAAADDESGGTFSEHARRPLEREIEHQEHQQQQQQQQLTSCDERVDESFSTGSGDDSELVSSAAAVAAALAARPPDIRVVHGCEIDFAQVSTIHHGKLSINWTFISKQLNRPYKDCQHKWYTIEALDMKKGRFTAEEDDTIARFKEKWDTEGKGKGLWVALQSVIGRRANNVRQRWVNVISKRATSAAAATS